MEGAIGLFPGGECRNHGLREEVVLEVAEVVGVTQKKIGERKSGEAGLAGGTKIEGSAGDVGLSVVVIPCLILEAEVETMPSTHQGQAGREIELGVPILDKTLSLGAHDVVGKICHAGSRWGSHDRRNGCVVTRRPVNGSQVKPGVGRRPIIFEPAEAGVEVKNRGRIKAVVVGQSGGIGGVFFRAAVSAYSVL
jgi:hypothetical protein